MRVTLTCLLVACMLFFSACAPKPPKAASKTPEELDSLARSFVLSMAAGRYDEASKTFTKQMAAAMPASKLGELWSALLAQGGRWQQIANTRFAEESGYRVVYVTAAFENGSIDIKVVFDDEAKVAGLWLGAFQPALASTEYTAPLYAREDSFTEQEVVVGEGQWALPGTLTMPKGEGPFPAVVLVHGSGPLDRDETIGPNKPFKDLAWGLASKGIAVLRYEKRTKHYAAEMKNVQNMTVKEETIDDAVAAVALLKETPGVDPERVFVIGHSLGAMLAPRIAEECLASPHTRIAGIVMLAPASRDLLDVILGQVEYLAGLDGTISEAESSQLEATRAEVRKIRSGQLREGEWALNAPRSYWEDLEAYDGVKTARELAMPMLILQGERDYQVTMEDLQGWKDGLLRPGEANARTNVSIKTYKDLNHLFISGTGKSTPDEYLIPGHVSEEVITDISNWVKTAVASGD